MYMFQREDIMNILLRIIFTGIVANVAFNGSNISAAHYFSPTQFSRDKKSTKKPYSINLMWINKCLLEGQEFICPPEQPCVPRMLEWAKENQDQDAVVNFWFDSEKTSADAVKKTRALIDKESCKSIAPIVLRDVRELPEVKENTIVFSDQRVPVYYRADLLRAIAGHNILSQEEADYFVYADLDIAPLSKEELFDQKTKKDLKLYGMVMAAYRGYENGFQIISRDNPNLLEAHKVALIDASIAKARNRLDKLNDEELNSSNKKRVTNSRAYVSGGDVYGQYSDMFDYFYHLEGCGKCTVREGAEWVMYDKNKHGLAPFLSGSLLCTKDWDKMKKKEFYDSFIATKVVSYPPMSDGYGGF